MHYVLCEESAQATVEYAIVTVALLSIVLAIAGLWRAGADGRLGGAGRADGISRRHLDIGCRRCCGC